MKRIEKFNARIQHEARTLQILGAGFVLDVFTLAFRDLQAGVTALAGAAAAGFGVHMFRIVGENARSIGDAR